ncbi:hypothetical protein [Sulfurimonas sp.]|uniref:hypothetical protein n=1 Tax=Sulfurimonas sp. TaxID=2022749 RepID=UPI002B4911F8|nr:hypothetical protein [Sulfurimonas sp.]
MPNYKIQLKQGKRTIVAHGEFKNLQAVKTHYKTISTMKVSEILKVEYEDKTTPPIDDYNYMSQFKAFVKNEDTRKSRQVIFNNLKVTLSDSQLYDSIKQNMEIQGLRVDSITTVLYKK